jgi:uncharacterized protein (TIGR03435 family)
VIRTSAAATSLFVLTAWGAFAQSASLPTFEVASVKPNLIGRAAGEGSKREHADISPGSVNMRNVSLSSCVQWAYRVNEFQISGPDWLGSERFDIVAKAGSPAPDQQMRLMLRALLADRFKLALHSETRALPVYVLVVGKNGPKFHRSEGEGESSMDSPAKSNVIGVFKKYSMQDLASLLSRQKMVNGLVLDETGLAGRFDFTLDFTSYVPKDPKDLKNFKADDAMSAIFSAVQDQLGLKLDAKKRPVSILVIDHAERAPTEN